MSITPGEHTSEHKITLTAMIAGILAIIAQLAGQLWLKIDLGVNVDMVLMSITGGGGIYTIGRPILKGLAESAKAQKDIVYMEIKAAEKQVKDFPVPVPIVKAKPVEQFVPKPELEDTEVY